MDYYKRVLESIKMVVLVVELPNKTRVAGSIILLQRFLRSLHGLRYYATQRITFAPKMLSPLQCRQVAEFEAVMRPAQKICFDFQSNRVEVAAETVLTIIKLKVDYQDDKVYDVIDVSSSDEWEPTRRYEDLPTKKIAVDNETAAANNIP